jgi:peptide/nickel transport system permease protein
MSITAVRPVVRRSGTRVPATVVASFVVVVVVLLWSLVPGLFTGQDPARGVPADKFLGPSVAHWFGTDHLGRDLFSRVVHGTASSVSSALIAVGIAVLLGGLIGLVAGFIGSWADAVLGRLVDVLLAIPEFLRSRSASPRWGSSRGSCGRRC